MDLDTFIAAWHLAEDVNEHVTLGGGEPTLCRNFPKIWEYVRMQMDRPYKDIHIQNVLVITNGTRYQNTMKLIREYEQQREFYTKDEWWLFLEMSDPKDGYHEMYKVDERIYKWFQVEGTRIASEKVETYGPRGNPLLRKVVIPVRQGRALNLRNAKGGCTCSDLIVKPDGSVWLCGCDDAPVVGSVQEGITVEWEAAGSNCWRECELEKELSA